MDTSNKIRVVDKDTSRMTRTESGGVWDPADHKHYPTLGGTEGAVGASASQRTWSTSGSFKETLLRTGSRTADKADERAKSLHTIPAHRSVEGDEPVQGGVGGAGGAGFCTPSQQAAARLDSQEDGFAPPSPRRWSPKQPREGGLLMSRHGEERFHRDLAHPDAFAALAHDGVRHELSQGADREELGQDSVARSENRESTAGSRPNNSGDHAGPGTKCLVMAVAIPVLAGACMLGAGVLFGSQILGTANKCKTTMLSWNGKEGRREMAWVCWPMATYSTCTSPALYTTV